MGHRRWLNASHKFRKDGASFDGTFEFEPCPTRLSGANVLRQLGPKHQPTNRQKRTRKGKEKEDNEGDHNWRKRSIFFELPYWEHNLIRHNLDVMHIEKNVCDNVLWTILNVDGKGKDNLNARRNLQDMGIRKALHPKKGVVNRQLCSKTLELDGLDRLQSQIALTLCHLERIFPPFFFDIMEHLPIHLAEEAKIAGPVQYRWMYFIERYLMTLKLYMRNRSHPKGSIAEGYLVEECMTFCSRYLDDVESKLNRPIRNYDVSDNPGILLGHALGKGEGFALDNTSWVQAHRYVLFNTAAVVPYREEHRDFIKRSHRRLKDFDMDRRHNDEFPRWFNSHVEELLTIQNDVLSDEIKTLALGPSKKAMRFSGYIINGTRYHTRSREWRRKTQNSGVMVKAKTCSYASTRDMNLVEGEVAYYGYVTDIIELYYSYDRRYVLFMCDWIDNNKGLKQDGFGFTLVNFNHLLYTKKQNSDEPFILASQAQQVFYVNDPIEADWDVVVKMKPRDLYEVCGEQPINDGEHHNEVEGFGDQGLDATSFACEEDINWVRQGEVGTTIDETIGPLGISTQTQSEDDEEMI
ncbi:uncharacterized protein LOC114276753 [Camellia sinensis]|uniref:uncharacterized protein LOC114276753 n=1 Tax=Camellia sinensis TaxID=4442 RepID=UPI001035B022|nr:uncharacterized protein LOC114276753 [Camellia sinensis]